MSALPPKADIGSVSSDVCLVPKADMRIDCLVGASDQVSAMDHRALAILHWSERLVGWNCGTQLIVIAWILRLFGFFHLEEIGGMRLATVGTYIAFAE